MSQRALAIACCRRTSDAEPADLFPDPDSELLSEALNQLGIAADLVSWDDPHAEWSARTLVVIRSTWDSVDRPDEYLAWARSVGAVADLVNPAQVLEWNLDKWYLQDLASGGVEVVPTAWVLPGDRWEPPLGEYVVKPSVSAGGRETARYGPEHETDARAHVDRLRDGGARVMIQPYLPSVENPGEVSLIFIDDEFSHAVRKGAVLGLGDGVQERPWEKMVFLGLTTPSAREGDAATATVSALRKRFGQTMAYSRIDLVEGTSGDPLVLEVELIDPNLSLHLSPAATSKLAATLARRIRSFTAS